MVTFPVLKKIVLAVLLCVFIFLPGETTAVGNPSRALFVSVVQEPRVLESREAIDALIDFSQRAGIKTLFVQVYRSNQAWFRSRWADDAPYQAGLRSVGKDPLDLLIRKARSKGIQVHAWLNLLSLGANQEAPLLKKYGPDILTRNKLEKKVLQDYKIDEQFFLEPGDPRVRRALFRIVSELLEEYPDLDGIQFDYIRYPDWQPHYGFTPVNMERYKRSTRSQSIDEAGGEWASWKKRQVTDLLRLLAGRARSVHPGIQVSTTGLMPYSRAELEASQDWREWVRSGLVDFVTLMCYSTDTKQFEKYLMDARRRLGDLHKANIAVGAYAMTRSSGIFAEQYRLCEESDDRACVTLHYGSLLEQPAMADFLSNDKLR